MSPQTDYDVVIVGGGLAGASLAIALSLDGWRVAVIEAVPFDAPEQPSYDERTLALAWGTRRLFDRLGIWDELAAEAAPIHRLHVSERGRFGVTRVGCDEYGVPALGYVVPNRVIGRALYGRLDATGVAVFCPAKFVDVRLEGERASVGIEHAAGQRSLSARLVVGADGARSRVRDALGIGTARHDYGQRAIVTTVSPSRSHRDTAYERFTPDGPVAVLPRDGGHCAVVWALPTATAESLEAADDDAFLEALQAAFGHRLGPLTAVGKRVGYPLFRVVADTTVTRRAVLLGSAGYHLHPAAAQGFNLAMRDAALLTELLAEGGDPGEPERLRVWREARLPDQRRVTGFTDMIVRLFSNDVPSLGPARGLGLAALDMLPTAKVEMGRRSMGLAVDWRVRSG